MPRDTSPTTLEDAVLIAFPWLVGGLAASLPLLLLPPLADRRWEAMIHLSLLVLFLFALTWRLGSSGDRPWFYGREWSEDRRRLATAIALIVIVTGVTALVTIASSAALQYQPSLQFLQLLSALDIAWVVAGTTLAGRALWGNVPAFAAGLMMSIICVLSIGLYLADVGLSADQSWVVDGSKMVTLVLPFDVAAAVITIGLTVIASRRGSGDTAGKSPVV